MLLDACLSLIHDWKQKGHTSGTSVALEQQQQQNEKGDQALGGAVDEAPAGPLTATTLGSDGRNSGQDAADTVGGGSGGATTAAAAGSFLHQLLAARDRGGSAMSDLAVVGQVRFWWVGNIVLPLSWGHAMQRRRGKRTSCTLGGAVPCRVLRPNHLIVL